MTNGSWLVLVPNRDGKIQIPHESLANMQLHFSTNKLAWILSEGNSSIVGNSRIGNPALIFLDLGLADEEKRHHISTFMWSLKDIPNKPLKTAEKIAISDKWQILLPDYFLSLFEDTGRRARLLLLNWKWHVPHGFALSFQQKFPHGSNGRI